MKNITNVNDLPEKLTLTMIFIVKCSTRSIQGTTSLHSQLQRAKPAILKRTASRIQQMPAEVAFLREGDSGDRANLRFLSDPLENEWKSRSLYRHKAAQCECTKVTFTRGIPQRPILSKKTTNKAHRSLRKPCAYYPKI